MAKFIIVMCAFIACAAAKPGVVAPLAYSAPLTATAYASPLAYSSPLAYTSPLAYSTPVAAPLAYSSPLAYTAPIAAPLAYANAHLDAVHSSRVDVRQNYNAAIVPATYAATPVATTFAAPIAPVAPLKYTAAPVLL